MTDAELDDLAAAMNKLFPPFPGLKATWFVEVADDGVHLTRLYRGRADARYRTYTLPEAPLALVAIAQGFEPHRGMPRPLDPVWQESAEAK